MTAATAPAVPMDWSEAQPRLRSVLRPISHVNALSLGEHKPWIRHLWPFVTEMVVIDLPEGRAVVTQRETAHWGIVADQAFATGRANLATTPGDLTPGQTQVLLDPTGDSYADSLILRDGWLSNTAGPDGARPVVFFPGDGALMVGTDDADGIAALFEAAEGAYAEAQLPISPQGYTVHAGGIVPFDLAGPHPRRELGIRARSLLAAREYGLQQSVLADFYETNGLEPYIGTLQLLETRRGTATVAVWGEGIPWELPHADYVMLVTEDRSESIPVPFSVLVDVVGILALPGVLPLRYSAYSWPTAEQWDVLRAHAVTLSSG